jgi:uncharacterized membrane protein
MPDPFNPLLFFGRLHPLLVHLPIGFLTLLAAMELARRLRHFRAVGEARGFVLLLAGLASVATVTCGLMLSSQGGYDEGLLWWHKWSGIGLGCAVLACGVAFWAGKPRVYAALLVATLLALVPASHFGGSLTHGENYLLDYAPQWMRPRHATPASPATQPSAPRDPKSAHLYPDLVQPILSQSCLACHGAAKSNGDLRLDSFAAILKGGKSGPAVVPGSSVDSLLVQRLLLPPEDPHHMPPAGKPQPTDDQLELLQWWIDRGAPERDTVATAAPTPDQLALVARLLHLPVPGEPAPIPTLPPAQLGPEIARLSAATGIVVTPAVADQPWIIVNASLSRSFGDAQLASLAPLAPNIVDLDLAGTRVTDAGLASVATMANLRRLRLDRTSITDAGLEHLAPLSHLQYLNLYGTHVTDASLKPLGNLPALRRLYLWRTGVDPEAAAAFARSKVNPARVAAIRKQIEALSAQVSDMRMEVVTGEAPASPPTSSPSKPASRPATTKPK